MDNQILTIILIVVSIYLMGFLHAKHLYKPTFYSDLFNRLRKRSNV